MSVQQTDVTERVEEHARQAFAVSATLMQEAAAALGVPRRAHAGRFEQLVASEAWTEAAFSLIEIALPQWRVRHLVHDGDVWHCAVSRHGSVPSWLDDSIDAFHELLPLAIVIAAVEARTQNQAMALPKLGTVPQCPIVADPSSVRLCCDNFA